MIVRFDDIGGIVDHHCLNIICFVDIGGIRPFHFRSDNLIGVN